MRTAFVLHDIWDFTWEDPKLAVTQWLGVTQYLEASVLRYVATDAGCWLALQLGQSAETPRVMTSYGVWQPETSHLVDQGSESKFLKRIRQKLYHLL